MTTRSVVGMMRTDEPSIQDEEEGSPMKRLLRGKRRVLDCYSFVRRKEIDDSRAINRIDWVS